ncbi:magnesium and cobalt transport protein, putative [Entamoeba invadens IP1]|uniref:Magnesium and cobalt transport protein, putative n=1 Tax=Entamoeba invadens IP1 TaxID=370355 RepID=A0A0A1TVY4_ENTIV|nr:magnesium and cobalt transport protein, putative [Entamoeba invadens IP1]ELP83443.1 magnesium and cobalt transport protein, putative [Entamoeba invadens IP1]|eukprot:XP_004182789.1 magnesium and cobalt transport protein, putative [Entamoeba invadens IP1]
MRKKRTTPSIDTHVKTKDDDDVNSFFPPKENITNIVSNEDIWSARDAIDVVGERVKPAEWSITQLRQYCTNYKNANSKPENHFLWIDIESPSKEVMIAIGMLFELHCLSVERWLDEDQREAVLIYPYYYEILTKNIEYHPFTDILRIKNTRITIKKRVIITFHQRNDNVFDMVKKTFATNRSISPEIILFQILHQSIMQFAEWVKIISDEIEVQQTMQLHVLKNEQLGFIARNKVLEDKIETLLSCLIAKKTMLRFLIRSSKKKAFRTIKDTFEVMLRDAYYDFASVYQRLKRVKELNDFCFNIYNVRLTIASTFTERETSKYIQVFNFISLIFFPITLVVNSFGCNIRVPWQSDLVNEQEPRTFFYIMLGCLGLLILQQIVFKKLKWY